jgi:hypothetical protein
MLVATNDELMGRSQEDLTSMKRVMRSEEGCGT